MLDTIDIGLFEKFDYSFEKLALQKRICGFLMLSPHNSFRVISEFVPADTQFPADMMTDADKAEILSYLGSFSDKLLLCEIGGKLCAFLPSLYPSSSLCLAIVFDGGQLTTSQILRLIACDECPDIFVLSSSVKTRAARITDALLASGESFFELCRGIRDSLLKLGSPFEYAEKESYTTLVGRVLGLSMLIGCPVGSVSFDKNAELSSLFDLPLFLSFITTFMLLAFNVSPTRTIDISLADVSGELVVKLSFDDENKALSMPFVEWETIASDKNMLFEIDEADGRTHVSFQPTRRDWSYLGLKQNTEFI